MAMIADFIAALIWICAGIAVRLFAARIANFERDLAARWSSMLQMARIASRFNEAHWQSVGVAWMMLGLEREA
jgi:hypothetical protein